MKNIITFERIQRDEVTVVLIYKKLSTIVKDQHNAKVLARIAEKEQNHYITFKAFTHVDQTLRKFHARFIVLTARILGLNFALRMMERMEKSIQSFFKLVIDRHPELHAIIEEEELHEQELLGMLKEERLNYVGSMILGLNDALVELTGALAGFTFAFRDTRLIALSRLITGISASLSMSSSEFLAHRAGGKAGKVALYTGIAYITTVTLLILPYFFTSNYALALMLTLTVAIVTIFVFNFYFSVAMDISFHKNFLTMAGLSLGVAALSFGIGILMREILGIDI